TDRFGAARNLLGELIAGLRGAHTHLVLQRHFQRPQLLAELDTCGAERLAQAHDFGADIRAHARDGIAILRDLFREKSDLPSYFGELSNHFLTQCIQPAAEPGNRFQHQFKTRPELLEQRAYPVNGFVRHWNLPPLAPLMDHLAKSTPANAKE